ncbi:FAD-binding protein, partial [bacterium]|nr:FAD-binding protein [bacterium]
MTGESSLDCIVVGGGLAGLACGLTLQSAGRRVKILEASDRIGGRVATDEVDGFRVDRGFQVYLDAYPEGQRFLTLQSLQLGRFESGALIAEGSRLLTIADPWRCPVEAVRGLLGGTVGLIDAVKIARLRSRLLARLQAGTLGETAGKAVRSTREMLLEQGFSERVLRRFFEPFFGGVFLERGLATSADVFEFTFAMFALGSGCLPAGGMAAIPRQLAGRLADDALETGCEVAVVEPGLVRLADGRELRAGAIVVATDFDAAGRLLPDRVPASATERHWKGTQLVAFAADRSPL